MGKGNLTVDINGKIGRSIFDNIPDLTNDPRHANIVNLVSLDNRKSNVLINLVVLRTLLIIPISIHFQHHTRTTHKKLRP